jgi:hypothetical protein
MRQAVRDAMERITTAVRVERDGHTFACLKYDRWGWRCTACGEGWIDEPVLTGDRCSKKCGAIVAEVVREKVSKHGGAA